MKMDYFVNSTALRTAKTPWSFGRSECNRVKHCILGQTQNSTFLVYQSNLLKYSIACLENALPTLIEVLMQMPVP